MSRAAPLGMVVVVLLGMPSCGGEREPSGATQGGSTTGAPDACMGGGDCPEAFCVAPWDAALGQRGTAECVAECIADDDLTRFCIDDASCCEGSRCNAGDGLCAAVAESSSTTADATTSDATTSVASTSTDTAGTSSSS